MKNLFATKFGKRVLIGGILLLAAALRGFAAVLSSFLPEPWNGLAANGCVVPFLRLHAKHKAEPDGGTPERNVGEAYDNTTDQGRKQRLGLYLLWTSERVGCSAQRVFCPSLSV